MVGRHSSFLVTKRSLRNADSSTGRRLRQVVQTKNLDDTVGLSRREEQELNKALYASLQENRRCRVLSGFVDSVSNLSGGVSSHSIGSRSSIKGNRNNSDVCSTTTTTSSSSSSARALSINRALKGAQTRKQLLLPGCSPPKRILRQSEFTASLSVDESSQDSVRSSTSSHNGSKRKIHAQRKFAQGCSMAGMVSCSPVKFATPTVKMLSSSRVPKTEDFLTFLCLRGSSILPAHLDFFNFSREELPFSEESSRSVSYSQKSQTEGTCDSSSTSSGANDEVAEAANISTPTMTSRSGGGLQAKRSAARASAGTPETARGIVSLRQDLHRKKSPLGAFTPVSSSGRSVRSGSSSQTWRSRTDLGKVRKSLFGNQASSKIQQESKKIVEKSTRRSSYSWINYTKSNIRRPNSISKNKSLQPTNKKRENYSTGETIKKSKNSHISNRNNNNNIKRRKKEAKINRRASTRLREMMQHAKGSNSPGSDNVYEVYGGRASEKLHNSHTYTVDNDGYHPPQRAKTDKEHTISSSKPRKPYKIRPLERVRTRAYGLLLASKLALKKARRENAAVKQKSKSEINSADDNLKRDDDLNRRKQIRTRLSEDKQQKATQKAADNIEANSLLNLGSNLSLKVGINMSNIGASKQVMAKTDRDNIRFAAKRTPHKKAKIDQSPIKVPSSTQENSVLTFHPTDAEFSDPFTYISKIQPLAEAFGMCRIVPPPSWKLDSNKITDDIRFTSQVQHIHRLYQRWGTNVQHSSAINHHLLSETSGAITTPQIGGIEIDLPQLYQLVDEAGGPKKMNDKRHWARIADIMNIPKQAMDRTMRIYDIYCRHVFPYATLSMEERKQLEDEVKAIHDLQTVEDDAVIRGKSMPVNWFNRIARNVQCMWFNEEVTPAQVEAQYWHIVEERSKHVAVQCGHINTRSQASAFPTRRDSMYSRHPWNLNNILENEKCVLKYLGPVPAVTIPTLHVNMLFSTSCWSTDPHNLPYLQYLHTGSDIIWYSIPKSQHSKFRSAMTELTPSLVTNKPKWLKEDCVMVNPNLLRAKGIKIGRCVQSPRHFVVVFPGTYTATISCGYSVAESVHYATYKWLPSGMEAASILGKSGEKELFSMSVLLCGLIQDEHVDMATLSEALPLFSAIVLKELELRSQLQAAGLRGEKRAVFTESPAPLPISHKKRLRPVNDEKVCDICDRICFLSMVLNEQDEQVLCLEHGVRHVHRKKNLKSTRLFLRYNQSELEMMVKDAKDRLSVLNTKMEQGTQEKHTRSGFK